MTARENSTRRRASGGYAAGAAAREKILDEATAAFSERGFRGASLAEIGRAADLTQQGVLYHFPSKAHLLAAVLEERDDRDARKWHRGAGLIGLGVLDAWNNTVLHNVQQYGLVRLAHILTAESFDEDHPARQYYVDHFDLGHELLLAGFQAGVEAGELRGDIDYDVIARQIIAMSEGLETQWLVTPDKIDLVKCFEDFTTMVRARIAR